MKNFFLRLLVFLLSIRYKKKTSCNPNRILILSTTGLGDTLWATPALTSLKVSHPHLFIDVLTSPIGKEVLKTNPYIHKLYTLKEPILIPLLRLLPALKKNRYHTIFIFHLSQRSLLPLCSLLKAQHIVGTPHINKGWDHLLTKRISPAYEHEIQRRIRIANFYPLTTTSTQMELFLTEEEKKKATQFLAQWNIKETLIVFHPGSKDRFKRWHPKHFVALGKTIMKHYDATLILSGNKQEKPLIEEIHEALPNAISIAGKCSIRILAALFEKCQLVVTNDTGPMHIAFAVKVPTICLFSPTDPHRCGPYHTSLANVISSPKTCTPCLRKACPRPFCMDQISTARVWQEIQKTLSMKRNIQPSHVYKGSIYERQSI